MSTQNESANRLSLPIRQFGDPVLRGQAEAVAPDLIGSEEIQSLIDSMEASLSAAGGIGLAAPQVGVLSRLFIVKISAMRRAGYGQVAETALLVVINPRVV